MDQSRGDDLRGRLFGVLVGIGDRFTRKDTDLIHEFIEVGEYGLALEQMADALSDDDTPITDSERASMIALSGDMGMGERVPSTLDLCPRAE